MSLKKTVLVIGNGFDIDLGLKTRYSDFAGDEGFFPENKKSNLYHFLRKQASCPNWGGIEISMEEYARLPYSFHTYEDDLKYFQLLTESFRLYFHKELYGAPNMGHGEGPIFRDNGNFNEDSCAYHLCYRLLHSDSLNSIISFNYTDICSFIRQIGEEEEESDIVEIAQRYGVIRTFVHRVKDAMVLGISGNIILEDKRYDFLKKTHQAVIPPTFNDLISADNVVFFGVSFSRPDYPYFIEFFKSISANSPFFDPRNIYVVSRDDESFKRCMHEIETMLDGDLTQFFNRNRMNQINTDKGIYSKGFAQLLQLFPEIR